MADEVIERYKANGNYNVNDIDAIIGQSRLTYDIESVTDVTIRPDGTVKLSGPDDEVEQLVEEYGGAGTGTSSEIAMYAGHHDISIGYESAPEDSGDSDEPDDPEKEEDEKTE